MTSVVQPSWSDVSDHEKENVALERPSITSEKPPPKTAPILEWQRQRFEEWMVENPNEYPTRDEKVKLCNLLSATYGQVTRLFANHRRRLHKHRKASQKDPTTLPKMDEAPLIPTEEASSSASSLSDEPSMAAICNAVVQELHMNHGNKKPTSSNPKRSRKRKVTDGTPKATLKAVFNKVLRSDEITKEEDSMPSVVSEAASTIHEEPFSVSEPHGSDSLLSVVSRLITQSPDSLPPELISAVNPQLIEAMRLLNDGVSWTHPSVLRVLVHIIQQQEEQQRRQQEVMYQRISAESTSSSPPLSESSFSQCSVKSTEELLETLSPDECLAVNILTDLANGW